MNAPRLFQVAFERCQKLLGLSHYHATFSESDDSVNYATCAIDPEGCVAAIRYNPAKLTTEELAESTAAHECAHLLIADLVHAFENRTGTEAIEEERIARRLEPILYGCLKDPDVVLFIG